MKIIPKEEIDRENQLRYELSEKKSEFARLIFEKSKTDEEFTGTPEQIASLPEGEDKAALIDAYSQCVTAAMKLSTSDEWFEDVQRMVEKLREDEENSLNNEGEQN